MVYSDCGRVYGPIVSLLVSLCILWRFVFFEQNIFKQESTCVLKVKRCKTAFDAGE